MTMEDDLNRIMEGNGIPFETTTSDSEDLSKENHEVIETEQKKRSAPKDAEAQMLSSRYANRKLISLKKTLYFVSTLRGFYNWVI